MRRHLRRPLLLAATALTLLAGVWGGAGCDTTERVRCDPVNVGACGQNQKCSYLLLADLEPQCHTLAGSKDVDEYCSGFADDCGPGLQCIADQSGQVFVCRRFCLTSAECAAGRQCNQVLSGQEHLCNDPDQTCDPLQQDCPEGMGCYAAPYGGFKCYPPRPNPALAGEECPLAYACEPGATCLVDNTSQSGARCFAFCDPAGGGEECADGQRCQPAPSPYTFSRCE